MALNTFTSGGNNVLSSVSVRWYHVSIVRKSIFCLNELGIFSQKKKKNTGYWLKLLINLRGRRSVYISKKWVQKCCACLAILDIHKSIFNNVIQDICRCFMIEQFIFAHVKDIKIDNKKLWTHSLLSSMETDRILFLALMCNIFNNTMHFLDQSTNILLNMTRETKVPKKTKKKRKRENERL